jgi:copper chaperone CopZ
MTTKLKVGDASCAHCKQTIEAAIRRIEGVTGAELDLESKLLHVEHGPVTPGEALTSAIAAAGYTPEAVSP